MGKISTVAGLIDGAKLGVCQPHEHVYVTETIALLTHPELRISNLPASIEELRLYKKAGGCSVVDAQPLATGRDARALLEASRLSGVNIIATTGYHLPFFYPENHWIFTSDVDKLTALFVSEVKQGMFLGGSYFWPEQQTDIRAGLVKAQIGKMGVYGREEYLLRAAGQASVEADVSLMLHTEYGRGVLDAIRLLSDIGLPSERVLICHMDRQTEDLGIHREVAQSGAFLEYDTITLFQYHNNASEMELLRYMTDQGFLKQLLLSTDPTVDRLKSYGALVGMDYLLTAFLPLMEQSGFTKEMLRTIMVENPLRALGQK